MPVILLVSLQIFEVATNTRIRDLILNITNKLNLASADGFSIFVKTDDKVDFTVYTSLFCSRLFFYIWSMTAQPTGLKNQ